MSGSPIIQNGRLLGAVTHVLINDPNTGYGIFIENMLSAANADGKGFVKKQGNIIPSRFDIALFYVRLIFAYWAGVMPVCALNTLQKYAASKTKPSNASVDKHKSKYADYKRKRSQS